MLIVFVRAYWVSKATREVQPIYELTSLDTGDLRVVIKLPGVVSFQHVDLDLSSSTVKVRVPGKYKLRVKLPALVDPDNAAAKFSKKKQALTVTLKSK